MPWKPCPSVDIPDLEPSDLARFYLKIRRPASGDVFAEHWMWLGTTDAKGYGQFWFDGRMHWAHRISLRIVQGRLKEGWTVHHLNDVCDEPGCVNPRHLVEVPHHANCLMTRQKGRLR